MKNIICLSIYSPKPFERKPSVALPAVQWRNEAVVHWRPDREREKRNWKIILINLNKLAFKTVLTINDDFSSKLFVRNGIIRIIN